MQIPILSGIYASAGPDFRTSYPRNMTPVPKSTGLSEGYLRPADGIVEFGTGPGTDRGSINWRGTNYRVMGTKLVKVLPSGDVQVVGEVGPGGPVTMDYGFDRLAIASGGSLYYCDGNAVSKVTDTDLGNVLDVRWVAGYFVTTDGEFLVVTELNDPTSVNPLKYGSSEADPDPILAVDEIRNEVLAFNRHSIEAFRNVGGDLFPFARIDGAQVPRGVVGTHAYARFAGSFAFLGGGRGEAVSIWLMTPGDSINIATREIDTILAEYTEAELAAVECETVLDMGHERLMVHLPRQTIVYDGEASKVVGRPVWATLASTLTGDGPYRARHITRAYDKWIAGDPTSHKLGVLTDATAEHFGAVVGWSFGTQIVYNEGAGAIFHELEMVCLTGRAALGDAPVVWTQHTLDGETWSQEQARFAGRAGERAKRIVWRKQAAMQHWRAQRFRGTSDAPLTVARLEVDAEPLGA